MPKRSDITIMFSLEQEGEILTASIKGASWFPYRTGHLKFHATQGHLITSTTYQIKFDSTIAPYVQYLEEGTDAHNIPKAFGRPLPFGTKGRFSGKFHPGSDKHKGFIKNKAVNTIVDYLSAKYKGVVIVK